MSKVIKSPVERWAGTVTLSDPLTLPQVAAFHDALLNVTELRSNASWEMRLSAMLPGIYACIERWDLQNFNAPIPEMFPGKPRKDAVPLAAWLWSECDKLVNEGEDVPKESSGTPTPKQSDLSDTESPSAAES